MLLFIYDLLYGLGQSLIFWAVALAVGLTVKKPIPLLICAIAPLGASIILALVISPIDWYGIIVAYVLSFIFLLALSRRKHKEEQQAPTVQNIDERQNRSMHTERKNKTGNGILKTSFRKIAFLLVSLLFLFIITYGVYLIITMSNTINEMDKRIGDQNSHIAAMSQPKPTPAPTENTDLKLIELETKYHQKESLLTSYLDKAKEIKRPHENDDFFMKLYSFAIESHSTASRMYKEMDYSQVSKDFKVSSDVPYLALKSACYYTYANEKNNELIEAEGFINMLKSEFSQERYNQAVSILDQITELSFAR